ncbi:MAG: hypothetical protein IJB54_04825 [Firmicutes bacterium]|nr:hypothetical protein [Bacillota bacterium]
MAGNGTNDGNFKAGMENEHDNNQNTSTSGNSGINEALLAYLKEMNETLHELAKNAQTTSQSNARNNIPRRDDFRKKAEQDRESRQFNAKKPKFRTKGDPLENFLDSFEDSIIEGFLGADFRDKIGSAFEGLADMIGVELEEIPSALGKEIGKQAMDAFKGSDFGKKATEKFSSFKDQATSKVKDAFQSGVDRYGQNPDWNIFKDKWKASGASQSAAKDAAANMAGDAAKKTATNAAANAAKGAATNTATKALVAKGGSTALTTAGTSMAGGAAAGAGAAGGAGAAVSGLASAAAAAGPYILIAVAAIAAAVIIINKLKEAFGPAIEGAKALAEASKKAANRYASSRKEMQENEKKRLAEDVNAMIEEPFKILEAAAQKAYDVWDANLRLINATQGYNKADLQSLMGSYAERLRKDNLTSVIASTDITESLAKVLDSGLSGRVAEEFAYLATKLNSAIPTQDFFNYAETYASIAANAIAAGKSEAEAISYANEQMELFASNVLFASRQLAGGFTTGLQDAQSLFESAVQIATAAKTNNSAQIGGVLTSVSAIVGAVAPDLSSSITETIVKAATGGNSEEIVALRSLAGIDAGNTAFLRALANDPQAVFSAMFTNLANMQNMSPDNYMEVAEGLSEVFGLSAEAFQRVDFNYLAQAISQMNVSNAALNENIEHLVSGETTTTAEQLKIAEINKYMLEEGLAYVLDNEVARAIQQHMWDEQLANELMEATYGVELQGAALQFLEGISQTVQNIIDFLNPFSWLKKIGNLIATANEANAQQADIKQLLELGKVGQGNAKALYNLTTRGTNLNLTDSIVTMMGGRSMYEAAHAGTQIFNAITNLHTTATDLGQYGSSMLSALMQNSIGRIGENDNVDSKYEWNSIGKSVARAIQKTLPSTSIATLSLDSSSSAQIAQLSATQKAQSAVAAKLEKLTSEDYMKAYVNPDDKDNFGYDKWIASAKSLGIQDVTAALKEAGYNEDDLKSQFNQQQAREAADREHEWEEEQKAWLRQKRDELWPTKMTHLANIEGHIKNIDEELLPETNTLLADLIGNSNRLLDSIFRKTSDFYDEWIAYYVEHTAYSAAYKHSDVDKIQRQSNAQQSDAVYALADALTQNTVDLKDPAVQTNAILSQILLVLNAIMQQNNQSSAGTSLAETLSGLAMGLIK